MSSRPSSMRLMITVRVYAKCIRYIAIYSLVDNAVYTMYSIYIYIYIHVT